MTDQAASGVAGLGAENVAADPSRDSQAALATPPAQAYQPLMPAILSSRASPDLSTPGAASGSDSSSATLHLCEDCIAAKERRQQQRAEERALRRSTSTRATTMKEASSDPALPNSPLQAGLAPVLSFTSTEGLHNAANNTAQQPQSLTQFVSQAACNTTLRKPTQEAQRTRPGRVSFEAQPRPVARVNEQSDPRVRYASVASEVASSSRRLVPIRGNHDWSRAQEEGSKYSRQRQQQAQTTNLGGTASTEQQPVHQNLQHTGRSIEHSQSASSLLQRDSSRMERLGGGTQLSDNVERRSLHRSRSETDSLLHDRSALFSLERPLAPLPREPLVSQALHLSLDRRVARTVPRAITAQTTGESHRAPTADPAAAVRAAFQTIPLFRYETEPVYLSDAFWGPQYDTHEHDAAPDDPEQAGRDTSMDHAFRYRPSRTTIITLLRSETDRTDGPQPEESDYGSDVEIVPDPTIRHRNSIVRLVFSSNKSIYLSADEVNRDSPNAISEALERNRRTNGQPAALMKIVVPEGHSAELFELFFMEYLRGERMIPLMINMVAELQPFCDTHHGPLEILYSEAVFWHFRRLQAEIFEEANGSGTISTIGPDLPRNPLVHTSTGTQPRSEAQNDDVNPEDNHAAAQEATGDPARVTAEELAPLNHLKVVMRVKEWLERLRKGPDPCRPTNGSSLRTLGWTAGRFSFDYSHRGHRIYILRDIDRRSSAPAWYLDGHALERSKEIDNVRHVLDECNEGGLFRSFAFEANGTPGVHCFYKTSWILVAVPPVEILSDILIVGWSQKGSKKITSFRSAAMKGLPVADKWTLYLEAEPKPYAMYDGVKTQRAIFQLHNPTEKIWTLDYV